MKQNEVMNQEEVTMSENKMLEFVNMYIGIVPKNQIKKFNALDMKGKIQKIKFYQDIIKMKEDARIKNSIPNKVKDLFDKRNATTKDAEDVIRLCNEYIKTFREKEIARLDEEIHKLEEMKQSIL